MTEDQANSIIVIIGRHYISRSSTIQHLNLVGFDVGPDETADEWMIKLFNDAKETLEPETKP